jgi:hypothetical protein
VGDIPAPFDQYTLSSSLLTLKISELTVRRSYLFDKDISWASPTGTMIRGQAIAVRDHLQIMGSDIVFASLSTTLYSDMNLAENWKSYDRLFRLIGSKILTLTEKVSMIWRLNILLNGLLMLRCYTTTLNHRTIRRL